MATAAKTKQKPEPEPVPADNPVVVETVEEKPKVEPLGRSRSKVQRPVWEHDEKFYEIRVIGDFGIGAQQRLNRDGQEFHQLWTSTSKDGLDEDEQKRLKFLLERMFNGDDKVPSLLDAPKSVLRSFNDGDKAEVVLSFTLAPLQRVMMAMMAAQAEQQEPVEAENSESTPTT